ncbi:hypothetical protein LTR78_002792 [Recurvomyces mirabilis]|uniref:Calponin-homology (CH) domain-containing protein n=1 Tax=Recurvomyces mirabilis TaxID=574656 RepID=A0AAE0WSH3_9PEZI|nr:hypothetical protein LTR78_002792 [Recurvomyces mirabilis]KAK5159474.1 hypothetical protein LTS14_002616 [Recurvomyces mirabilis]
MSRISMVTPCPSGPVNSKTRWPGRDDTLTIDIDYTRALRPDLTHGAKPRRKSTFVRKTDRNIGITIFEDVLEDVELALEKPRAVVGATLLGKPAQKLPMDADGLASRDTMGKIRQPRTSLLPASTTMLAANATVAGTLKKNPRRRTIYVPDDTTMLTIHPGANSTRLDDTFQLPVLPTVASLPYVPRPETVTRVQEHSPPAPGPRMSMAPKRAPLRHMRATTNVSNTFYEVAGQGGGKENVPPRASTAAKSFEKTESVKPAVAPVMSVKTAAAQSRLFEPTVSSQARQTTVVRKAVPAPRSRTTVRPDGISLKRKDMQHHSSLAASTAHSQRPRPHGRPAFLKTFQAPASAKLSQYPVLVEDVEQPQLYGTGYLSQEEIALTELVNTVYDHAQPKQWEEHDTSLRQKLLEIYHRPEVTTLHNRMQASLECGALSRPKDMSSPPDITQDLGLRKRFLRLWLRNYEPEALQRVAEVVVGRQMQSSRSSSLLIPSAGSLDNTRSTRSLVSFFETFFVIVEDLDEGNNHGRVETADDLAIRRWQKTVLRSLMLTWLLDQAKVTGTVSGRLFKSTAQHRSSAAVLHALSSLLVPSIGDITRTLRRFDFMLEHVQDPLDEVDYHIGNIAIDFRDGIRLTRLVELLLFSGQGQAPSLGSKVEEATMTLHLPDQMILKSDFPNYDAGTLRVLSQHVKMPCLGRAQKLYNVQIALTALQEYSDWSVDITADDIVDGHREKTINLLYDLINQHVFTQLVGQNELAKDIEQTGGDTIATTHSKQSDREDTLLLWATARCSSVDKNLQVRNLTTSFADGKVYNTILTSFADVLPFQPS